MIKKELCIMPPNDNYSTVRFSGSERHEVFGASNRNKSIEDGLVVFLTPQQHRGNGGVHSTPNDWYWLKELAQQSWMEYYNKTKEDFLQKYGRNYL
jgi:hypothetical protein